MVVGVVGCFVIAAKLLKRNPSAGTGSAADAPELDEVDGRVLRGSYLQSAPPQPLDGHGKDRLGNLSAGTGKDRWKAWTLGAGVVTFLASWTGYERPSELQLQLNPSWILQDLLGRLAVSILVSSTLAAIFLWRRRRRRRALAQAKPTDDSRIEVSTQISIGGVPIDVKAEGEHFLFAGATGTGKTQGINRILKTVRARNARAIIADAGGASLAAFWRPGDKILNPLDARSVDWSPFAEIRASYDCSTIARAVIPDTVGESQAWHHYAQAFLADTLLALHEQKIRTISGLMEYLFIANRQTLQLLLQSLPQSPSLILCAPENEKMLSNTRAVMAPFLAAWRYLPDKGSFSVRNGFGRNWSQTGSSSLIATISLPCSAR